ncbi:hypothetical protein BDB01DRAFT_851369 [Pilobolus umbonatus]|nr:hypothetical protein BDB01DRAFT_851369 [Pilobolus umbonatus]
MASLYVHNTTRTSLSGLSSSWETVTPTNHQGQEGRSDAQLFKGPDNKMYIQGGFTSEQYPLNDSFIVYDADTNAWTTLPDFNPYGLKGQIYYSSSSYVPSINKILFYGGITQVYENTSIIVDNITVNSSSESYSTYMPFGFTNPTAYDLSTQQWTVITNATNQDKDNFIYSTTAVHVSGNNTNYYLDGGISSRANPMNSQWLSFSEIYGLTFPGYYWSNHTCTGNVPSRREYHSTTLLPDNKTVMLYGGKYMDSKAFSDACYLLDLDKKVWKDCGLTIPQTVPTARYGHSAVLVDNRVFILFGVDAEENALNDVIILDVSDPNNIFYVPEYAYGEKSSPIEVGDDSKGLGVGAIVGIVVGCVAVLAIILAAFIFYKHRKNKASDSIRDFPVDWNQIDQEFNHNQQPKIPMAYHNQYSLASHSADNNDTATTTTTPPPYHLVKPSEMSTPIMSKPHS